MQTSQNLTGKQKRFLRAQAVTMKPLLQIGKNNLTDEIKSSLRELLDARELVKVQILNNSTVDDDDVAAAFIEMGLEIIQKIGNNFVVYKVSDKPENRILSKQVQKLARK
jgi:RNA-binding protein